MSIYWLRFGAGWQAHAADRHKHAHRHYTWPQVAVTECSSDITDQLQKQQHATNPVRTLNTYLEFNNSAKFYPVMLIDTNDMIAWHTNSMSSPIRQQIFMIRFLVRLNKYLKDNQIQGQAPQLKHTWYIWDNGIATIVYKLIGHYALNDCFLPRLPHLYFIDYDETFRRPWLEWMQFWSNFSSSESTLLSVGSVLSPRTTSAPGLSTEIMKIWCCCELPQVGLV